MITREERIELIRQMQEMRDRIESVLEILVPDDTGGCLHPPSAVVDESTMGDPRFVCTRCGHTQTVPFTEVSHS